MNEPVRTPGQQAAIDRLYVALRGSDPAGADAALRIITGAAKPFDWHRVYEAAPKKGLDFQI